MFPLKIPLHDFEQSLTVSTEATTAISMQHMFHLQSSQLAMASLRSYMVILIMIVLADIAFCPIRIRNSFLVFDFFRDTDTRGI
jgi:hypothetical protein